MIDTNPAFHIASEFFMGGAMKLWAVCVVALALAACSGRLSEARVADPLPAAPSEWVELHPEPVRLDGRTFEATCSEFPGADPAYSFWARRGTENKLVIYFDGGGACWDDVTCSVPRLANSRGEGDGFYKAELLNSDNPNRMSGIFDLDNPANPVRNWSIVFIPYCTGDVHAGANTAHYNDPDTGELYKIEHRGADNFRVVLKWLRDNFDAPEEILVTGSSAGAYGAAVHFPRVREAFPNGRAVMLGDAGQGVTTPDFLTLRNGNWRYQLPENVFGRDAALTADDDLVGRLATHYPGDLFAQYTTAQDRTQAAFYALMGAGNACSAWTTRMNEGLQQRQGAANFRSYVAAGQSHTILRSPGFYREASGGVSFRDWFAGLLGEAAPASAACPDCAAPPPPRSCGF
jgi:hypothetical protein